MTDGSTTSQYASTLVLLDRQRTTIERTRVERFAMQVRASLDGTLLRYSQRKMLLRLAEQSSISRFDANLIIASVQHQQETARPPRVQSQLRKSALAENARSPSWWVNFIVVAGLQSVVVATAWWAVHGLW